MTAIQRHRHSLNYRKKTLFSIVVTASFFVLLESLLYVADVRPSLHDRDPFVGFESSIPLFVEQELDGQPVLQTAPNKLRYFNPQRFRKEKSADTIRVFCLGGSTTFGRPYDDRTSFAGWLRELLPLADPSRRWEVINAGGVSYASYRVASLVDELVEHAPDLFIVYTGHNEFLEERSYRNLRTSSRGLLHLSAALHRSRTFSLANSLIASDRLTVSNRDMLPQEVDAILDHSVGPVSYHRDDALRSDVLRHFEFNLRRIVHTARSVGAEVIFVKPTANLKDFSPFKSEPLATIQQRQQQQWNELFAAAKEASAVGQLEDALEKLSAASAIDDRRADLHYQKACLLFERKRYAEARESFQRAVDEDVCPLRAISDIQRIVEQTAIEQRAPLIDFDSILRTDCWIHYGHEILGQEYFVDHVHPTIQSHRLLSLAIIEAMQLGRWVKPIESSREEMTSLASERIESRVDTALQARALTNLAQVLNWAGKREEAGRLAQRAVALRSERNLDDDPESMLYAAVSYAVNGDDADAITLLQKVVALQPDNAQARWRLAALLYDQSNLEPAILHFREAIRLNPTDTFSYRMLGLALNKQGKNHDAIEVLSQASRLAPNDPAIRKSLTMIRKQLDQS